MAGGRIPLSALYWPVTVQQVAALTVHGALRHAARHPAGKIAVAYIQPVYTPFRSVLNKRRWRLGPPSGDFSMGWMPLL